MKMANIFDLPSPLPTKELFETLLSTEGLLIERIISTGQSTPENQWYDQDRDEWVIVLQGEARLIYEDKTTIFLQAGDYLLIKAHQRHRVDYTSSHPPCIWLAIHY
ncbi:MAG: cupin domain-containing protein [Microcystaceae cyanobacterium]